MAIEEMGFILSVLVVLVCAFGLIMGYRASKREINIEVGEKERHKLLVKYNQWRDGVEIYVDGEKKIYFAQVGTFKVGKKEQHEVEINTGGRLIPKVEIKVDGKLIQEK